MSHDPDDGGLRRAYTAATDGAPRRDDCPTDEQIWEASRGHCPGERAQELLTHAQGCPACAESWRMARVLGQEGTAIAATSPRTASRRWVALAAAAVFVLAMFWIVPRSDRLPSAPPGGELRTPSGMTIVSELDEALALPREAFTLRWSGPAAGTIYTLEVATLDLTVVHRAVETEATEHRVPEQALEGLAAGAVLLWRVDAVLPDAARVSSPTFRAILQ